MGKVFQSFALVHFPKVSDRELEVKTQDLNSLSKSSKEKIGPLG